MRGSSEPRFFAWEVDNWGQWFTINESERSRSMSDQEPKIQIGQEARVIRAKRRENLIAMTQIPLFAVLMIICARIGITGSLIPVTLQLPMAILSGLLLGPWKGCAAQGLYLLMGLLGLPVFSGGGGLSYVLMPSFGFLLGFPISAFVAGLCAGLIGKNRRSTFGAYAALFLSAVSAIAICYLTGAGYLYLFSNFFFEGVTEKRSIKEILAVSVLPFIWKDLLMMIPVAALAGRLRKLRALGICGEIRDNSRRKGMGSESENG